MDGELKRYLNRPYEMGYHSAASMYAIKECESASEDVAREFRECIKLFKMGLLCNHEYSHLMFVSLFMKSGHFEVYNNDVGDILCDLVEIGLSSNDGEVIDMAISVIENHYESDSGDSMINLLRKTTIEDNWLSEYRDQVLLDIEEER